jgi:hypothetical protein
MDINDSLMGAACVCISGFPFLKIAPVNIGPQKRERENIEEESSYVSIFTGDGADS